MTFFLQRKLCRGVCLGLMLFSLLGLPESAVGAAPQTQPQNIDLYFRLFPIVETLTSFPFSAVGLGGAEPSRFVADELINHHELRHTTVYLKIQIFIRQATSPDTVAELQTAVEACDFLSRRFGNTATATDAQGNAAICMDDIVRLFLTASGRERKSSRDKF